MIVGVLTLLATYGTASGVLSAVAFLAVAIPLSVFCSLHRCFISGSRRR
jgi:ABC-type glycerol-3-phosphate transport system permease component